jgi:hypothetical protein
MLNESNMIQQHVLQLPNKRVGGYFNYPNPISMYLDITLYLINMYNYYVFIENKITLKIKELI